MAAAKKKPTATKPPELKGFVEPSSRVFTDWTEARIRQAEYSANNGNLYFAAELCEWLLTDDRVASGLDTRVQTLLGLDPTFEASGDKRRSNRAVKALDAGEDFFEAYPETEIALIHKWGLLLGVAPAQQPWRTNEDHGGRWLAYPEFWHPQHLRQDQRTKQWFIKVANEGAATSSFQEIEIVLGAPEWMLHMPYGKSRPWAWALWRALARMVLIKFLARGDWSRAGEKGAILALEIAMVAAQSYANAEGKPQTGMRQLATDIYNRGRNGVAALPPGVQLKAIDTVTKAKELYESPIQLIDAAIAILIRGGNLSTLTEGGSKAAAEVQTKAGDLPRLRFDAQSLTTTIHDQSLVHWAQFNYGDRRLAPWPVYPVEPEEDRKGKSETEEKAFANVDTAELLGFEVDRQAFIEEYKITWCKPGERPPEPAPIVPPEQGLPGEPVPGEEPVDPEADDDESKPKPPAEQRRSLEARATESAGYDNGAEYADKLFERTAAHGAKALMPTLAAIVAVVNKASDYDEAKRMLAERFEKLPAPTKLAGLIDAALTMGQLAGSLSVREDVPELSDEP